MQIPAMMQSFHVSTESPLASVYVQWRWPADGGVHVPAVGGSTSGADCEVGEGDQQL